MVSVNIDRLRLVKNRGNICLCDTKKVCPCDDFLDNQECKCKVYIKESI